MAEYLIQDTTLQGIADAIREVKGTTGKIKTEDFKAEILDISSGSGPYCWKKFSTTTDSEGNTIAGEFVEYIVSDTEGEYPDQAVHTDGYWYELNSLEAIVNTEGMYCWAKFNPQDLLLPTDYTEVEYLASNKDAFINTGIIPNGNTRIKLRFSNTVAGAVFGSETAWTNGAYAAILSSATSIYYCYATQTYNPTITTGNIYEIDFNGHVLNIGGSLAKTFTTATINNGYPLYLFTSNRSGSTPEIFGGKIYSRVEIYQDGINLSRYLITCKDSEGNYGMYDTVNKEMLYNIGSGSFTAGEEIETDRTERVTPLNYSISDDLNTYPQAGFHTDGFYYKLMESDLAWDERGQYAWEKESVTKTYPALTATGITLTKEGNSYSATTQTGNGWGGTKYFNSNVITIDSASVVDVYHTYNTGSTEYYFGFAANSTTAYTDITSYVRIVSASIYSLSGSTGISCTAGDVIHLQLKGGLMSVYKNDTLVFSESASFNQCVVAAHFYHGSKTYAFEISAEISETLGYVIGNEENAYPNDGFADDGYYYVKVGATKVSQKCASGQTTSASNKLTVSGLGFRPYAFAVYYGTSFTCFVFCDESGNVIVNRAVYSTSNYTATPTITDDGFTYTCQLFGNGIANINWYAIGY